MSDLDDEHGQDLILQFAKKAIVADAIAPEVAELRAFQRLAKLAWIVGLGDPGLAGSC